MTDFVWGGRKSAVVNKNQSTKDIKELIELPQLPVAAPELAPPAEDKFLIHRSAILSFKSCPYQAYLTYWYKGHGVIPTAMPQHLLIGICIHRGLQHLLEHCRIEHPSGDFKEKCIDDAVMYAHEVYAKDILAKREIELKKVWNAGTKSYDVEDLNYTVKEIYNLIEALIRAFAAYRLKSFLEEYEVLEVEKEEVFESFSDIVTWLGKSDGLLRRRIDNELVVLSFKTAAEFANNTLFNILIDMQGCSEIVMVEERLDRLYKNLHKNDGKVIGEEITLGLEAYLLELWRSRNRVCNVINNVKVFANQYEYLIKGKHRADSSEPLKFKYQTHLLHPIKSNAVQVMQLGSGLRFGSSGSSTYEWIIPQGKLPKGKMKIDIADDIGVNEWISRLANLEIQPEAGNPFQDVIIGGERTIAKRSLNQLKEWRISTQFEAETIARSVSQIENLQRKIQIAGETKHEGWMKYQAELLDILQTKLLQFFSRDGKDAGICFNYYGGKCPFTSHCHEGLHIDDGLESGMFIVREPHHELEVERFKEKGYLKDE